MNKMTHEQWLRFRGEFHTFLKWCDNEDMKAFLPQKDIEVQFRLCAIALQIGYRKLALSIMAHMDQKQFDRLRKSWPDRSDEAILDEQANWVADFVAKQPPGKSRNKLLKVLYNRGMVIKHPADGQFYLFFPPLGN